MLAVHRSCSFLFVCFMLICVGSFSGAVNAKTVPLSYTHITTQYKFSPTSKRRAKVGLVTLTRSSLLKNRPRGYGRIKLSPSSLRKILSAKSAIVMDAVSQEIVYSHLPDRTGQPASTIKVLTGIIAIDSLNDHDMVSVSRKAARMPRSKIYLRRGRKYPADDLINAVLLTSANDASVALAEKIAGSERVFAKLMTAKARSYGARNTVCKTANGLTAKGQRTTARDLALIFNGAMQEKLFAEKLSKRKIQCDSGMVVYSHNKALWRIAGSVGGKTGYTNLARQTYVGKFKRNKDELIVALLGSETMWSDVKRLVEYGFAKKNQLRQRAAQRKIDNVSLVQLEGYNSAPKLVVLSALR